MRKIILSVIISFMYLSVTPLAKAQNFEVEVSEAYNQKASYDFGSQWQYLTTELYLMNMKTLDKLVDETFFRNDTKRKKKSLKSAFITARLDGTTTFNGITYPLYYFKTSEDGTFVNIKNNNSGVRIIDNLPVSTVKGNKIDAVIDMQFEMQNSPNIVLNFISEQLGRMSSASIATPVMAAKILSKEFSQLITPATKPESMIYEFSSTIRIFEDERAAQKRIYSIAIYFFKPSVSSDEIGLSDTVKKSLTAYINSNPVPVSPSTLVKILGYQNYPFMIAVNYKSKYEISLDKELDEEKIISREILLKNSYDNNELNPEIYGQEKKLNEFLKLYVKLKNSIKLYDENKKITNNFSQMNLTLLKNYKSIKNFYEKVSSDYKDNETYKDCFANTYQTYINDLETNIMESSEKLQIIKRIVRLIQNSTITYNDNTKNEKFLELLKSVDFPDNSDEDVLKIKDIISRIEANQYNLVYAPIVAQFEASPTETECLKLEKYISETNCEKCSLAMQNAVNKFRHKQDESEMTEVIIFARKAVADVAGYENKIEKYLAINDDQQIYTRLNDIRRQKQKLLDMIDGDKEAINKTYVKEDAEKLKQKAEYLAQEVDNKNTQISTPQEDVSLGNVFESKKFFSVYEKQEYLKSVENAFGNYFKKYYDEIFEDYGNMPQNIRIFFDRVYTPMMRYYRMENYDSAVEFDKDFCNLCNQYYGKNPEATEICDKYKKL
ncbi:MAG: hypothetical protein IIU11_02645 [Bacteroidales bacterium]|nr:hypothetical protein [Bacteroidales bacterium]